VVCGYLDTDLRGVADEILLEAGAEPYMEITARDLRHEERPEEQPALVPEPELVPQPELALEPEPEPDTAELEPVLAEPPVEGVTASTDWGSDDPEDYSAPV
jgi:hypothetical protein